MNVLLSPNSGALNLSRQKIRNKCNRTASLAACRLTTARPRVKTKMTGRTAPGEAELKMTRTTMNQRKSRSQCSPRLANGNGRASGSKRSRSRRSSMARDEWAGSTVNRFLWLVSALATCRSLRMSKSASGETSMQKTEVTRMARKCKKHRKVQSCKIRNFNLSSTRTTSKTSQRTKTKPSRSSRKSFHSTKSSSRACKRPAAISLLLLSRKTERGARSARIHYSLKKSPALTTTSLGGRT